MSIESRSISLHAQRFLRCGTRVVAGSEITYLESERGAEILSRLISGKSRLNTKRIIENESDSNDITSDPSSDDDEVEKDSVYSGNSASGSTVNTRRTDVNNKALNLHNKSLNSTADAAVTAASLVVLLQNKYLGTRKEILQAICGRIFQFSSNTNCTTEDSHHSETELTDIKLQDAIINLQPLMTNNISENSDDSEASQSQSDAKLMRIRFRKNSGLNFSSVQFNLVLTALKQALVASDRIQLLRSESKDVVKSWLPKFWQRSIALYKGKYYNKINNVNSNTDTTVNNNLSNAGTQSQTGSATNRTNSYSVPRRVGFNGNIATLNLGPAPGHTIFGRPSTGINSNNNATSTNSNTLSSGSSGSGSGSINLNGPVTQSQTLNQSPPVINPHWTLECLPDSISNSTYASHSSLSSVTSSNQCYNEQSMFPVSWSELSPEFIESVLDFFQTRSSELEIEIDKVEKKVEYSYLKMQEKTKELLERKRIIETGRKAMNTFIMKKVKSEPIMINNTMDERVAMEDIEESDQNLTLSRSQSLNMSMNLFVPESDHIIVSHYLNFGTQSQSQTHSSQTVAQNQETRSLNNDVNNMDSMLNLEGYQTPAEEGPNSNSDGDESDILISDSDETANLGNSDGLTQEQINAFALRAARATVLQLNRNYGNRNRNPTNLNHNESTVYSDPHLAAGLMSMESQIQDLDRNSSLSSLRQTNEAQSQNQPQANLFQFGPAPTSTNSNTITPRFLGRRNAIVFRPEAESLSEAEVGPSQIRQQQQQFPRDLNQNLRLESDTNINLNSLSTTNDIQSFIRDTVDRVTRNAIESYQNRVAHESLERAQRDLRLRTELIRSNISDRYDNVNHNSSRINYHDHNFRNDQNTNTASRDRIQNENQNQNQISTQNPVGVVNILGNQNTGIILNLNVSDSSNDHINLNVFQSARDAESDLVAAENDARFWRRINSSEAGTGQSESLGLSFPNISLRGPGPNSDNNVNQTITQTVPSRNITTVTNSLNLGSGSSTRAGSMSEIIMNMNSELEFPEGRDSGPTGRQTLETDTQSQIQSLSQSQLQSSILTPSQIDTTQARADRLRQLQTNQLASAFRRLRTVGRTSNESELNQQPTNLDISPVSGRIVRNSSPIRGAPGPVSNMGALNPGINGITMASNITRINNRNPVSDSGPGWNPTNDNITAEAAGTAAADNNVNDTESDINNIRFLLSLDEEMEGNRNHFSNITGIATDFQKSDKCNKEKPSESQYTDSNLDMAIKKMESDFEMAVNSEFKPSWAGPESDNIVCDVNMNINLYIKKCFIPTVLKPLLRQLNSLREELARLHIWIVDLVASTDSVGWNMLHWACHCKYMKIIRKLVDGSLKISKKLLNVTDNHKQICDRLSNSSKCCDSQSESNNCKETVTHESNHNELNVSFISKMMKKLKLSSTHKSSESNGISDLSSFLQYRNKPTLSYDTKNAFPLYDTVTMKDNLECEISDLNSDSNTNVSITQRLNSLSGLNSSCTTPFQILASKIKTFEEFEVLVLMSNHPSMRGTVPNLNSTSSSSLLASPASMSSSSSDSNITLRYSMQRYNNSGINQIGLLRGLRRSNGTNMSNNVSGLLHVHLDTAVERKLRKIIKGTTKLKSTSFGSEKEKISAFKQLFLWRYSGCCDNESCKRLLKNILTYPNFDWTSREIVGNMKYNVTASETDPNSTTNNNTNNIVFTEEEKRKILNTLKDIDLVSDLGYGYYGESILNLMRNEWKRQNLSNSDGDRGQALNDNYDSMTLILEEFQNQMSSSETAISYLMSEVIDGVIMRPETKKNQNLNQIQNQQQAQHPVVSWRPVWNLIHHIGINPFSDKISESLIISSIIFGHDQLFDTLLSHPDLVPNNHFDSRKIQSNLCSYSCVGPTETVAKYLTRKTFIRCVGGNDLTGIRNSRLPSSIMNHNINVDENLNCDDSDQNDTSISELLTASLIGNTYALKGLLDHPIFSSPDQLDIAVDLNTTSIAFKGPLSKTVTTTSTSTIKSLLGCSDFVKDNDINYTSFDSNRNMIDGPIQIPIFPRLDGVSMILKKHANLLMLVELASQTVNVNISNRLSMVNNSSINVIDDTKSTSVIVTNLVSDSESQNDDIKDIIPASTITAPTSSCQVRQNQKLNHINLQAIQKFIDHKILDENKWQCRICCAGETVSIAYVPCGHQICKTCCDTMKAEKCPFCRTRVEKTLELFFN